MRDNDTIKVSCPTCRQQIEWCETSPYRPFCSKRCQLIDLGDWASEENRIPSDTLITEDEMWDNEPLTLIDRNEH